MNIFRIAQTRLITNVTLDKDTIKQREKEVGDARFTTYILYCARQAAHAREQINAPKPS